MILASDILVVTLLKLSIQISAPKNGSPLKFATWICGGLSFTQRELCRELNLFIIGVYMPHGHWKKPPFFSDTMERLEEVLKKVRNNDCIIILGDLNCKLARNTPIRTWKWCTHKMSSKLDKEILHPWKYMNEIS